MLIQIEVNRETVPMEHDVEIGLKLSIYAYVQRNRVFSVFGERDAPRRGVFGFFLCSLHSR